MDSQLAIAHDNTNTRNLVLVRRVALAAIVLAAASYYLQIDNRFFAGDDSALYLALGRNLARGSGMVANGRSLYGISPGMPLLWAAVTNAGQWQFLVMRVIMLGFAATAVVSGYLTFKMLRNKHIAVVATVLLAANPRIYRYVGEPQTDMPFMSCFALAIAFLYLARRGKIWAIIGAGLAMGAGSLFRLWGLPVAGLAMLGCLLDPRLHPSFRRRVLYGTVFFGITSGVVAAWYIVRHFWLGSHGTIYAGRMGAMAAQPPVDYLHRMVVTFELLGPQLLNLWLDQRTLWYVASLLLPIIGIGMVKSIRRSQWIVILPAIGYLLMRMLYRDYGVLTRYLLPVLVILTMWLCDGIYLLFVWIARRQVALRWLLALCMLVGLAALASVIVDTMESYGYAWKLAGEDQAGLAETCRWVRDETSSDQVCAANEIWILNATTERLIAHTRHVDPVELTLGTSDSSVEVVLLRARGAKEDEELFRRLIAETDTFQRVKTFGNYDIFCRQRPSPDTQAGRSADTD